MVDRTEKDVKEEKETPSDSSSGQPNDAPGSEAVQNPADQPTEQDVQKQVAEILADGTAVDK